MADTMIMIGNNDYNNDNYYSFNVVDEKGVAFSFAMTHDSYEWLVDHALEGSVEDFCELRILYAEYENPYLFDDEEDEYDGARERAYDFVIRNQEWIRHIIDNKLFED